VNTFFFDFYFIYLLFIILSFFYLQPTYSIITDLYVQFAYIFMYVLCAYIFYFSFSFDPLFICLFIH
jgi:hypothetical protein